MSHNMPELFAAAYLVPKWRESLAENPEPTVSSFYTAMRKDEFPYDLGDDPAFFSARHHDGPVTWGVCRPDVRCLIQPGDWMVFFAAEKERRDSSITRYRFSAACRVARKISHTAIFTRPSESMFRDYLNLLVRRRGRAWEHFEPCLRKADWHKDWLWRICERTVFSKDEVLDAGNQHRDGDPLTVNERPAPITDNYIIFSKEESIILPDPPLVATHHKGQSGETWNTDHRTKGIRALVFGKGQRQCLRTSNPQQPHRHFRRPLCEATWAEQLRSSAVSQNLGRQH